MMPAPYQRADYYKSETVGDFRIGRNFADCHLVFGFSAQQLTIKNDSIQTDIEYSFDGQGVAYRLKKGTDEGAGGEWYDYIDGNQDGVYLRIARDEYESFEEGEDDPNEQDIPFRVAAYRGVGGRSS